MGRSASTGPFWQPSGSLWRAVSRPSAKACSTCSTPSRSTSPWWATRYWWCRWRSRRRPGQRRTASSRESRVGAGCRSARTCAGPPIPPRPLSSGRTPPPSFGVCLALAGLALHQVTGSAVPDALASIAIGLLLVVVAVRLASRERELLTNQSAPPSVVSTIRKLLEAAPGVSVVPRLEVLVIGPRTVLVTAEVGLNDSVTGEQVTRLVAELRDRLRGQAGVAEVYLTPVAP